MVQHAPLLPRIPAPVNPFAAKHSAEVVREIPIYVNRPVISEAEIERALEQEFAA